MKALIFDFNGVLLWDTELQELAWDKLARKLRGKPFSQDEKFSYQHGRTNKSILEYLTGKKVGGNELDRLVFEKESIYQKLCLGEGVGFKLSPGAVELLEELKRTKTPTTIATSSGKGNVDFFVKYLHLANWFNINNIVYDDGSFRSKPAPDIYLKACKILGVDPGDATVVEDSKSGIESAVSAGIGRVYALGPKSKWKELSELTGVYRIIENLGELRVEI